MSIENLAQYFSTIEDPRCSGKVEHRLMDILVIAVCVVIACAESWDDIALYGRSKLASRLIPQFPHPSITPTPAISQQAL